MISYTSTTLHKCINLQTVYYNVWPIIKCNPSTVKLLNICIDSIYPSDAHGAAVAVQRWNSDLKK